MLVVLVIPPASECYHGPAPVGDCFQIFLNSFLLSSTNYFQKLVMSWPVEAELRLVEIVAEVTFRVFPALSLKL